MLRWVPPLRLELSPGLVVLVFADVVEVVDEVVDEALSVAVEDCGAVLTGDHDARAMAEKVSDGEEPSGGEEPLHHASPQHSHTCVFEFHTMYVWASLAGRYALVNTVL